MSTKLLFRSQTTNSSTQDEIIRIDGLPENPEETTDNLVTEAIKKLMNPADFPAHTGRVPKKYYSEANHSQAQFVRQNVKTEFQRGLKKMEMAYRSPKISLKAINRESKGLAGQGLDRIYEHFPILDRDTSMTILYQGDVSISWYQQFYSLKKKRKSCLDRGVQCRSCGKMNHFAMVSFQVQRRQTSFSNRRKQIPHPCSI